MRSYHRLVFGLGLLVAVAAMTGCGGGKPGVKVVKVSGVVQLDGKPLDGAQVNFLASQYAGVATTGPDGKYEMEAQTGENKVYIRKFEGVGPSFDATMMDSVSDTPGASGPKQVLPKKFSDPDATELKFAVPDEGTSEANFDLTSR